MKILLILSVLLGASSMVPAAQAARTVASAWMVAPGQGPLDFRAQDQNGKWITLSQFRGKPVLLYFYPKDETRGCTTEACSFRDAYSKYRALGAVILGVSHQSAASHREFEKHHHLPFQLLTDTDGKLAHQFGIELMKIKSGEEVYKRESILIGPDGRVAHLYANVDPADHWKEVLSDIKSVMAQPAAK